MLYVFLTLVFISPTGEIERQTTQLDNPTDCAVALKTIKNDYELLWEYYVKENQVPDQPMLVDGTCFAAESMWVGHD